MKTCPPDFDDLGSKSMFVDDRSYGHFLELSSIQEALTPASRLKGDQDFSERAIEWNFARVWLDYPGLAVSITPIDHHGLVALQDSETGIRAGYL